LHCVVTAFPLRFSKEGDPTAFIICSRTQTPSLGVLGDSTAFLGDAGILYGDLVTIQIVVRTPP
jgi:hypothetical protein